MAALGLEILGVTLAVFGWIVGIVSCALPMWKVTAFIGVNIVTAQTIWEGIWMNCVVQSTGQMQCKVYDSMLALSSDLQAARALCVIAIVMGVLGLLLSIVGAKCTNCLEEERINCCMAKYRESSREQTASCVFELLSQYFDVIHRSVCPVLLQVEH
uniref:Claudin 4 n=1 Tax=Cyprinus carpio TaxID=7962 RepID=A0A8C1ZKT9_CYPCA